MERKFLTKRLRMVLILAVVMAVIITLFAALSQDADLGEQVTGTLLSPFRSAVAAIDRRAERLYGYIFRYETLLAENEALKKQLAEGEDAVRRAEQSERELKRLQELLELREEHPDYKLTSAYVVSWDTSVWGSTVTIDKGSSSGLETGMCAVTQTGQVVGLVTETGLNWATVTTIFHSGRQIGATVSSTGSTGVLETARQEDGSAVLTLRCIPLNTDLRSGDSVVTSGALLYPRGLLLGKITSAGLDDGGTSRCASVQSELAVDELEQIFLITDYTK